MSISYFPTVRYWLEVEALSYPDLPKAGARQAVKTYRYANELPWEAAPGKRSREDHKYFVFFGLIDRTVLERELRAQYQAAAPDDNYGGNQARPDTGRTFLCAVEVNCHGQVAADTLQTAAFAMAFAEKKHGCRIRPEDVNRALADLVANLAADADGTPVKGAWFASLIDFLTAELAWRPGEMMAREQICVQRVSLLNRNGKPLRQPPEIPPINSFFVDDLNRIVALAEKGQAAKQVERYINGDLEQHERLDVTGLAAIDQRLHPKRFPAGRWPSAFPLFLMQQVAVNGCFESIRDGGIFSVNGPPGTGKTTLLMDIIAARVVERAKVLSSFAAPEQAFIKQPPAIVYPAFGGKAPLKGSSFNVDQRLLDFGIVVASSNNNAVENITIDLPSAEKIDASLLVHDGQPFDYFAATADALLNKDAKKAADEPLQDDDVPASGKAAVKCWGLVSVPLGKKSNRNRAAFELGAQGTNGIANAIASLDGTEFDWPQARTRFARALQQVERLQDEIAQFDAAMASLSTSRRRHADAAGAAREAGAIHASASEAARNAAARDADAQSRFSENMAERTLLTKERSRLQLLIGALFRTRDHKAFIARRRELELEYDELRKLRARLKRDVAVCGEQANQALRSHQAAMAAVDQLLAELEGCAADCARLAASLGPAAFDAGHFAGFPVDEQQKSLPRSNRALHVARAELFVSALHLHKAFMKNAGKGFETNFRLALSMLEQQAFLEPHLPAIAPHLWATFFLVVPVVSSTFASFSRCFQHLGEEQIGLLLIDEAGQAVPAHALGAIWRSKRAVIVGDPLQVEPVVRMEPKLDLAIIGHHGAREAHLLTRYSAQHLADRGSRFGANVVQYDGQALWVGSPLRVHRRCVDPMFSLSNAIAYNDKMVFGPDPADEVRATRDNPLHGPSRWIHVETDDFVEHFSRREGMAAVDIVVRYRQNGWVTGEHELPDLFVISPFRSVAEGVAELLRERAPEWAGTDDDDILADWLKAHVGTVHTFQGKESDTVLFVLGGKTGGARSWAATRPNIINVAATRAKRRLYVIGNRNAWRSTTFGARMNDAMAAAGTADRQPEADLSAMPPAAE